MLCEFSLFDKLADEFDFGDDVEELIARSKIYGTKTSASVRIDPFSGKITGWDSLFELLDMDDDYLAIDLEDADEQAQSLLKKVRPGDYTIKQIDTQKFVIIHRDGTQFAVHMLISDTGKVTY